MAFGGEREREQRKGMSSRESESGSRGWRGTAGDVQGEEEAARQGGAGLLGRARASTQLLLLAGGRRQEGKRWWTGPVGWAASWAG